MTTDRAYDGLAAYTLVNADARFLHQHVVDAHAVQTAAATDRPIRVAQALVGLYLHVEGGLSGRQVQRVHQLLAERRPDWPAFALPDARGAMTAGDVVAEPAGGPRDRAIEAWAASTWRACAELRPEVERFLASQGITVPTARRSARTRKRNEPPRRAAR